MINYVEALGMIAMLCVLSSFLTSGEKRIRTINIVGATLSVIYGAMIQAPSIIILNGTLFFVHIYKLYKMKKKKQ